jgi:hypothetical protein
VAKYHIRGGGKVATGKKWKDKWSKVLLAPAEMTVLLMKYRKLIY